MAAAWSRAGKALSSKVTEGAAAVQVAVRVGLGEGVRGDGGEQGVLQAQRSEQTVLETTGQRLPVHLFCNEAKQRVVGVGVVEACTGREVGRVLERDRQHFGWGPDLGRVTVEDRPESGSSS